MTLFRRFLLSSSLALSFLGIGAPFSESKAFDVCFVQPSGGVPIPCPVDANNYMYVNVGGGVNNPASAHLVSSTLTKIAGAGTYTSASTTSPQAICLFASVTACAPLTLTVSSTVTVNGFLTKLALMKSTTGATAATFRVFAYKAAPTLTSVFNTTVYLALAADILSGAYIGSWECATQVVNTDNSYYDCSNNTPIGYNQFQLTDGILRFVIVATGAYVSGSSETFTVLADITKNVQ